MLVELPARLFDRLIRATTGRRRTHDLFDANFGSAAVIGCYPTAHVALGNYAHQLATFDILNHRRTAAT